MILVENPDFSYKNLHLKPRKGILVGTRNIAMEFGMEKLQW